MMLIDNGWLNRKHFPCFIIILGKSTIVTHREAYYSACVNRLSSLLTPSVVLSDV